MYRINDAISIGGQPCEDEIPALRRQGYQTVVNFRDDGETSDQLPPDAEGTEVQTLGMRYVHLPTVSHTLTPDIFDRFRATFGDLPRPIYAHCATGKRAAALVLAALACARRMGEREIEELAIQWGLKERRDLIAAVKNYVARHGGKSESDVL